MTVFHLSSHALCSFPLACTSWHIRSQPAFQRDTKQHLPQISLFVSSPFTPLLLSMVPAIAGKNQNLSKWKGGGGKILGIEKGTSKHWEVGHKFAHCSKNSCILSVVHRADLEWLLLKVSAQCHGEVLHWDSSPIKGHAAVELQAQSS